MEPNAQRRVLKETSLEVGEVLRVRGRLVTKTNNQNHGIYVLGPIQSLTPKDKIETVARPNMDVQRFSPIKLSWKE